MFDSQHFYHIAMTLNAFKPMSSFVGKSTHANVMRQHDKRDMFNTVSEYSKFSQMVA